MVQMAETTRGMASGLGTFLGGAARGKAGEPGARAHKPLRSGPRISHSILADMLTVCLQKCLTYAVTLTAWWNNSCEHSLVSMGVQVANETSRRHCCTPSRLVKTESKQHLCPLTGHQHPCNVTTHYGDKHNHCFWPRALLLGWSA